MVLVLFWAMKMFPEKIHKMTVTATKMEGLEHDEDPPSKTVNKMVVCRLHLLEHMC